VTASGKLVHANVMGSGGEILSVKVPVSAAEKVSSVETKQPAFHPSVQTVASSAIRGGRVARLGH